MKAREPLGATATHDRALRRSADQEPLRLVVTQGPDRGSQLLLADGLYHVGKDVSCELALTDAGVSRRHLQVQVKANAIRLRDLDSKNGSYYRGARFDTIEVVRGARIELGDTELRVEAVRSEGQVSASELDRFGELRGQSEAMRQVFALLERIAVSHAPVLILGETGTGKELAARGLHRASARAGNALVTCDLAGITTSLIDSELFGHVRGAFTGADRDRKGVFESAHKGTLFLDEVGELPLDVQPRLLRALEGREVKRVGEGSYRKVDVRVVAATNRDLNAEVQAGRFRADLYHRLAVVTVELPPLRQRPDDVPMLAEHFLRACASAAGRLPPEIHPDVLEAMSGYHWPGNARELRNVIERAIALAPNADIIDRIAVGATPPAITSAPIADTESSFREAKEAMIRAWERQYVSVLIDRAKGNVSLAARRGGLDRAYLHRLLKKHGLSTAT